MQRFMPAPQQSDVSQQVEGDEHEFQALAEARDKRADALADQLAEIQVMGLAVEAQIIATAVQLGLHNKPIGILNTKYYYNPLLEMLQKAVQEKFVREDHLKVVVSDICPENLFRKMKDSNYKAPEKWIEKLIEKNKF